jgi:hypothetical protein
MAPSETTILNTKPQTKPMHIKKSGMVAAIFILTELS